MQKPPFSISPNIIDGLTKISFLIGKVQTKGLEVPSLQLRKENQIRTIHSTLAIEGNALSADQVTALLEGKKVKGSANEIKEVQNAIKLYQSINKFKEGSVNDFLKAHGYLMKGLISEPGAFRRKNVGVLEGDKVIHAAPRPNLVSGLMENLFKWIESDSETHLILKSCITHYEIEFIHPFMDGNGRMGRFWQTLILNKLNPVFKYLPTESLIHEKQKDYYKSLGESDKLGESTPFIEFMLYILVEALEDLLEKAPSLNNFLEQRFEILKEIFKNKRFSRKDYMGIVPEISTASASRDLKSWVDQELLIKHGERNQTKYSLKA